MKSKVAFFVMIFLFGVVISIRILDVYENKVNLENGLVEILGGEN